MANQTRASEEQFDELHRLVTETLISKIKCGEASPSDLKVATDWLHKNNVTGVAVEGSPLEKLLQSIPEIDFDSVQQVISK
jgi:hypothetical protein